MAPKVTKRKASQQDKNISLYEPINTEEWKCVVMLAVEYSTKDIVLMRKFVEGAAFNLRKEVRSLDFEWDIMRVLREFLLGELSFRNGFLLNFSPIFEEAAEYVKKTDKIPASLMVKIIKAFILMMKKENEDQKMKLAEYKNDQAEIATLETVTPKASSRRESKDKGKPQQRKESGFQGKRSLPVKIKPQSPVKEDTKLFKRGEPVKGPDMIDDAPINGYFQLYIVVTGFYDSELALEMIKWDIPLHCVLCLNSASLEMQQIALPCQIKMQQIALDSYWEDFLKMLWNPSLTQFFSDVIFQVFSPVALPAGQDLKNFMYREISFLLYDLSDLKLQHANYLRHMKVWEIDDGSDRVGIEPYLANELDLLPYECITMPLIMQYILDCLCGEDSKEFAGEHDLLSTSTFDLEDSFKSLSSKNVSSGMNSNASIIPFYRSNVKIPSPKWSSILDDNYKIMLYKKMKSLDKAYHIEDMKSESGTASGDHACFVGRRRLPCKNLDTELRNQAGGLIAKFWNNYPIKETEFPSSKLTSDIKFSEFVLNYCLYAVWLSKLNCPGEDAREEPETLPPLPLENLDSSDENFTVTDCSRTVLQKTSQSLQSKEFFCPSRLKIVPKPLVTALSAPEMRTASCSTWTKKYSVSDLNIPVKSCQRHAVEYYGDLNKFLGANIFQCLKDYDFIEELNKENMVKRIDESALDYDHVQHSYSALTDSIYVVMYNFPTTNSVHRQTYNALLSTPVGLRDFYDYILDEEREWLEEQKPLLESERSELREKSFTSFPYNASPSFGNFVESDFWHENSIKYALHRKSVTVERNESQQSQKTSKQDKKDGKKEKEELPAKKNLTPVSSPLEEPYHFVGFNLQQGTVQFSWLETTYRGPFNSSVKVSLQERLYGSQELGIHIRQDGHVLHLYSYVCPEPHTEQPYVCHIEHKKGIIVAFARRMLETTGEMISEESNFMENNPRENFGERSTEPLQNFPTVVEDGNFAYDVKLSLPNGLTVETVRKHMYPCYIKQSYVVKSKNTPLLIQKEKNRLFLPNGSIVKIMTDNTVEVLRMDTSIVTASLDDFVLRAEKCTSDDGFGIDDSESEAKWTIQSFTETKSNGFHCSVLNGQIDSVNRYQILSNTDTASQAKYSKRTDFTEYVLLSNGTLSIEFRDGSKISTAVYEEDWFVEVDFDEERKSAILEPYIAVNTEIVMEHSGYATAVYDSRNNSWRLILPCKSEIEISSTGHYHVNLGGKTELKIESNEIDMWTSNTDGELITRTTADLTVFKRNVKQDSIYCTTHDSAGKKFIVHSNANCYVVEDDVSNESENLPPRKGNNCEKDNLRLRKHFVVRRDLTGFEIIHKEHLKEQLNNPNPGIMVYNQKLNTSPATRYFVFLDTTTLKEDAEEWMVKPISPDAKQKAKMRGSETSSTYATPPSWTHLFPKKKKALELPKALRGRIVLEIQPTDLPDPVLRAVDFTFCDVSQHPEPKLSLTDRVQEILKKVALQDRRMLMELYLAAVRTRLHSKSKKSDTSTQLETYLKASAYHIRLRETLKNSIRYKIIPKFFDQTTEMVQVIIRDIIDSIGTQNNDIYETETYERNSEEEYDLEHRWEESF